MKVLSLNDLPPDDMLHLELEGSRDADAALDRELAPLLQVLERYAGDWMPEVVKGRQHRRYSPDAVWKALEEKRDEYSSIIGLRRMVWPAISMDFWIGTGHPQ